MLLFCIERSGKSALPLEIYINLDYPEYYRLWEGESMKIKRKNQNYIKLIILLVLIIATITLMVLQFFFHEKESVSGDITVGQALFSIARTRYSQEELGEEYKNAIKLLEEDGIVKKNVKTDRKLTYDDVRKFIKGMDIHSDEIEEILGKKTGKVDALDWSRVFEYLYLMSEYRDSFAFQEITVAAYDKNQVISKEGTYSVTGISGKSFFQLYGDCRIGVMTCGKEVLFVKNVVSEEVTYENIWIYSNEKGKLQTYMYGCKRNYNTSVEENMKDTVADITVTGGKVTKLSLKRDEIEGKVLAVDRTYIEIEGFGKVPLDENFKVYKNYGNLQETSYKSILVGYNVQNFVVAGGKLCAAVIHSDIRAKNIRVLIKTTGFTDIYHKTVELSCKSDYKIKYGDKEKVIKAGKTLPLSKESKYLKEGRVLIEPVDSKAKLQVNTVERSCGNPLYRGTIEVALGEGGLLLINELTMEEYLYGVVPSEMPTSYGQEALMVQAVCARTYAYRQVLNNSYGQYGAHVDDSVSYQVYNNVLENEDSISAVKGTYGMIMTYEKQPIQAFFFSTSCGATTEADIWGSDNLPYIWSRYLSEEKALDLSDEKVFDSFIREKRETYDSAYDLYRWKVTLTQKEVSESVNRAIQGMADVKVSDIGMVTDITPLKRGKGGVLKSVKITGTEGRVTINLQSNIRQLFDVSGHEFTTNSGNTISGFSSLPSACFVVDKGEQDKTTTFTFVGGGYGHGVGMSQNATKTMAEEGMTYDEILAFFYKNIEILNAYDL